ncbi:hypothetical protein IWQ56_004832, partial [Coemansia nantahalensis]
STNTLANRVCEKALRAYFAAAAAAPGEMRNKSWYDARVLDAMRALGFSFPDFGRGFEHRSQQSFDPAAASADPPTDQSPDASADPSAEHLLDEMPAAEPDDEVDAPLDLQ